ncbi:TRAP transporter substrate-binding protein [Roseovarius pacificus]|uniref:TRAP transporter substrate-binding protein n=1 Tax=Roseovarius pacificus TaxID=337701 RepID=UPI002A18AF4F|nr:TRAP transporter substrate-binding protein [Roseovarius pacificus]
MYKTILTGVVAAAMSSYSLTAHAADVTLNLSNEYSANSVHGQGDQYFADLVAEKTDGSVEIVVHYGGALGYKSADHFDAVGVGALEIADTYGGALGGIDPIFLVSSLPFLTTTLDEAESLYGASEPALKKVFEENDQILLYASPWPPSGLWGKAPLNTVDALSGVKIRTYDKNGTTAFNSLGAAAVRLSWADVVPSISTGAIDAVLTSAELGAATSFWDYFDHYSEIYQYSIPVNLVHMSKTVFDGLTEEQQTAILEAASETRDRNWAAIPQMVEQTYADLDENGVTIVQPSGPEFQAQLQDAGKLALDEWLESAGEAGQAIIDDYMSKVSQ